MHVAVLDQTRQFFRITENPSVLAGLTPARFWGNVVGPAPKNGGQTPKKPPRRKMAMLASIVLAPAAIGLVYEPWNGASAHTSTIQPNSTSTLRTVAVDRPSRAASGVAVLPATFRPWQTALLHGRVSGYLAAWHKDLGANVKTGELLAEIDTPELDQELAVAKALVHEGVAAASQAKAERVEAEADLKVAESQLVRARAEVELAKSQLVRRAELLARKVITKEEYDTFSTQAETRAADVKSAEDDLIRRRTNLDTRTAIIEAREATVRSRQSSVDRLQELQGFKRIVAPFDGVITRRSAEVGMLVAAGQGSLFVVEDLNRVRVQINVPQAYAMRTIPGVAATIRIPESSFAEVSGTITRVSESVDSTSRTMLAEIELENPDHRFQPGIYAQVALSTPQDGVAWTIPANTVSMRVEGPHVAIVNDQNRIEIKPVRLGRDLGNRITVTEGIQGDEQLVINPGDDLVRGLRIQVAQSNREQEVAMH